MSIPASNNGLGALWAVAAVARIDIKNSLGSPAKAIILTLSTCMSLITVILILSGSSTDSNSRLIFLFPGLVTILGLSCLPSVSGMIRSDVEGGTVAAALLSPSAPQTILVGHLAGSFVRIFWQATVLLTVVLLMAHGYQFGGFPALGLALLALVSSVVVYGSLGALLGIWLPIPQFAVVINMLVMSLSVVASTVYFPLERVPWAFRSFAYYNPASAIASCYRGAFCGECTAQDFGQVAILFVEAVVLFGLAWLAVGRIDGQLER